MNCRLNGLNRYSPIRIILDTELNIKTNSNIFKNAHKFRTIIFYNKRSSNLKKLIKIKNIKLIHAPLDKNNKLDLLNILKKIKKLNINYLLVEGGKSLTKNFLKCNLFNEFYLFSSSKIENKIKKKYFFNIKNNLKLKFKKQVKLDTYLGDDNIIKYF